MLGSDNTLKNFNSVELLWALRTERNFVPANAAGTAETQGEIMH